MTQQIYDQNLSQLLTSVRREKTYRLKKEKYFHAIGSLCLLACIVAVHHSTGTHLVDSHIFFQQDKRMKNSIDTPASIPYVIVSTSQIIPPPISALDSISIPTRPLNQLVTLIDDQDFLILIKQNGGGWISGHGKKILFVRSNKSQ